MSIAEASMGASYPEVAVSLNNLAMVMQDQGELDAAKVMYQRNSFHYLYRIQQCACASHAFDG